MLTPIELLDKIKDTLDAHNVPGGLLADIKWLDWGAGVPQLASSMFPLIFIGVDSSRYPPIRAAKLSEESYDDYYYVAITVASYIVKGDTEGGYKAAMRQATGLFNSIKRICHENKKWDGLCYTSEFSEADMADWGAFPMNAPGSPETCYGITGIMLCRSKGQTS